MDRSDIKRTPEATNRAAGSFMSSGNEKNSFIINSLL